MVTREQALVGRDFHFTGKHDCLKTVGPRGGETIKITNVRASGKCKTWVKSPERFHLPVKYGLYESYWIDETNCSEFHLASECPLNDEKISYELAQERYFENGPVRIEKR